MNSGLVWGLTRVTLNFWKSTVVPSQDTKEQSIGYMFISDSIDETIAEIKSRNTFMENELPSSREIKGNQTFIRLIDSGIGFVAYG